jgi:hypothetical protein
MNRMTPVFLMLLVGCATSMDDVEAQEQEATEAATRVYNIVDVVLPAGNHDGTPGDECVALLNPEHRLRSVILVEAVAPGATCALAAYTAGDAVSFTWGDTSAYTDNAGRPVVRAAVGDSNGAVHRLSGTTTSEAPALADLTAFLALPDAPQGTQLLAIEGKRVHSIYDFEGDEQVAAEAAYQSVRVTQTCEQPGTPRLDARYADGFVRGYVASNSGSCHSGWFSRTHVYNRAWRLVASYEYSE